MASETHVEEQTIIHLKSQLNVVSGRTDSLGKNVQSQAQEISTMLANTSVSAHHATTTSAVTATPMPDKFTVGSTEQQVKNVMGVPTSIISNPVVGDTWMYGFSSVDFDTNGEVKGWNNASNNLKLR